MPCSEREPGMGQPREYWARAVCAQVGPLLSVQNRRDMGAAVSALTCAPELSVTAADDSTNFGGRLAIRVWEQVKAQRMGR